MPTRFRGVAFGHGDQYTEEHGGHCVHLLAAQNLNYGDAVYATSTANTVNKSVTAADGTLFVGVVVGGDLSRDKVFPSEKAPTTGTIQVVTSGRVAIIQIEGITKFIADGAVAVGARLQLGTVTAGRVDDPVFVAGQVVGICLEVQGTAGNLFKGLIYRR